MSESLLEKALEERKNTIALVGLIGADEQRKRQIEELKEQKGIQLKLAATEENRLQLERQRLSIEQERVAALKSEAEAVKSLRRMLVDIGSDIQQLRNDAKGQASRVTI
jgi:hypothetical protein